jgi:hypothetical protein
MHIRRLVHYGGAAAIGVLLLGAGLGQASRVSADAPIVCTSSAPAPSMSCVYNTPAAIAAGGTMTLAVTGPAGVSISGLSGNGACPDAGVGTANVVLSCPFPGSGLAAATPLTLQFSSDSAPVNLTVNANANGPIAGIPAPTNTSPKTCSAPVSQKSTCTINTTTTTAGNGVLKAIVIADPSFIFTPNNVQVTNAPASFGSCALSTALPEPAVAGLSATLEYVCAAGENIPSGAALTLDTKVNFLSDAPSIKLMQNANGPTKTVPAPTTQNVTFVDPAGLAPATVTLECNGVSVASGQSGLTLPKFSGPESCTIFPKTLGAATPVADGVFQVSIVDSMGNNALLECGGVTGCLHESNETIDSSCGSTAPSGTTPSSSCYRAYFDIESALSYGVRTGYVAPGTDLSGSGTASVLITWTSTPGNAAGSVVLGTFQFVLGGF